MTAALHTTWLFGLLHRSPVFFFRRETLSRECRSGAGKEATKDCCDTPGFELRDTPTIELHRKSKKLLLRRNHRRMNQVSIDMMRSWRGNCDVQILIYDSPPDNPDVKEISRVTDYVVGYTCKGGTTLMEERETNKRIAMAAETVTGTVQDLRSLVKRIMNKAAVRRMISKQEACVLLGDLPLTLCTERIDAVSLSKNKKLSVNHQPGRPPKTTFNIDKYENRSPKYHHMNLYDYYILFKKEMGKPNCIPHFTGVKCTPTFPVSEAYARHTLLVFRPWTMYPSNLDWIEEFDKFINNKELCPRAARMTYDRVLQRFFDGTKFVDPVAKASTSQHEPDPETEQAIVLSGLKGDPEDTGSLFFGLKRGLEYDWGKTPKVSFLQIRCNNRFTRFRMGPLLVNRSVE